MRFTFLAAVAACGSLASRPQVGHASAILKVGNLVAKITTSPSDGLIALKGATDIVNDIFAETGNATDHITEDDTMVLKSVVDLVQNTIYTSMDMSQKADESDLEGAVGTAAQCNTVIAARQSPEGDLGKANQGAQDENTEVNRLGGIVTDKDEANNTKWDELAVHMEMIAPPPGCPGLPEKKMGPLDVFFEKSDYVVWFNSQKPLYEARSDAFNDANSALLTATNNFNLHVAVRDQAFCDWKNALEAACVHFDTCFGDASASFSNTLVPRVTSDMNGRIEVLKAGETLIHQIKFLLAEVDDQETPTIDTSRYEITFPVLPEKGLCDLSPLDADDWVPTPSCEQTFPRPAIIKNFHSGRRLYAQGQTSDWESGVGAVDRGTVWDDQKWLIDRVGEGKYILTNFLSKRRLYAQSGKGHEDGVGAVDHGTVWDDQKWFIEGVGEGKYKITNVVSKRRLFAQRLKDFEDGVGAGDGGIVFADQKWLIESP